ncbi:MAG: flagellar brake protein [Gallionella sp.]|nr:flagellar brake protein [Gallionella sp.]
MKYETLSRGEENEHGIVSAKEIVSVLKHVAENATRVALYYVDGSYFILTTLLGVSDKGLWLEQAANGLDNQRILESGNLLLVSTHLDVKVQFAANQIRGMEYQGYAAFHLPLPKTIYRLQRRESFRLDIPSAKPLRCVIPAGEPKSGQSCEVNLMDISAGGMKLTYAEGEAELVQGQTYENCQIKLHDMGTISVTIIVRSLFSLPTKSGHAVKRAGCQFINLSGSANILLQRYINSMQRLKNSF